MANIITKADLGYPGRRHVGLVEENSTEVISIGEDFGLARKVGAAGINLKGKKVELNFAKAC